MSMRAAAAALAAVAVFGGLELDRAFAQKPGKPQTSPAQVAKPAAAIAGIVEGPGGTPMARARVVLQSARLEQPRATMTDAQGGFAFRALPAGQYAIHVSKSGFALPHAAAGPAMGVVVQLGESETPDGVRIPLRPAGTIPGRLLDDDGTPMAGAEVQAVSLRSPDMSTPASTTRTDDRGEFRLTGLAAGQYFVLARDPAFVGVGDESGVLRYAPTYHPGVLSSSDAQPVPVAEGAESPRLEFRLRVSRPARISGALMVPENRPLLNGAVVLVPRDQALALSLPADDAGILPNGHFYFRNVPPGTYQIRARAESDRKRPMLFGTFTVTVEDHDVSDISIGLSPGPVVSGRIEWRPARGTALRRSGIRVRAPLADGSSLGDSISGDVNEDGTFRIRGVMPGLHFLIVEGLPDGWAVHEVRVRGRDFAAEPIHVPPHERVDDVRVVVSAASQLAGTVRDGAGRPAADTLVVTMPPSWQWTTRANPRMSTVRTDRDGRFRFRALARGDYRVTAVVGVEEPMIRRREWLDRLTAAGVPISLAPSATTTVDLVGLSADAIEPSRPR